jgi:hypothetical protein
VLLVAHRGLSSLYYRKRCVWLQNGYRRWIENSFDDYTTYVREVKDLWTRAGIEDRFYTCLSEPQSVFQTFPSAIQWFINNSRRMFDEAIGVYRSRAAESLNPLFWLRTIIFLPVQLLQNSKSELKPLLLRIVEILYWVAIILSTPQIRELPLRITNFVSELLVRI